MYSGLETDAVDLKFFDKPFVHAHHHVVDETSRKAVHGLGTFLVVLTGDDYLIVLQLGFGALGKVQLQFALGAFHRNRTATEIHLHGARHRHGHFTNS